MDFLEKINFGFFRTLPIILQTEAAECGLACLGMISSYYGYKTDLMSLRRRFSVSLKGSTLNGIMQFANSMDLGCRPLRLDLDELKDLRAPCILHWEFNHFVILKEVNNKVVIIHDPASGVRKLSLEDVSKKFTGVALELWPAEKFVAKNFVSAVRLGGLIGRVRGVLGSFVQILILALALEIFSLLSPFFLQWVIDDVIVSADRDLLSMLTIGFGLLMFLQQIVQAIRSWVILYFSTTFGVQWQANIFSHLIRLPVEYFEKRHLGDLRDGLKTPKQL